MPRRSTLVLILSRLEFFDEIFLNLPCFKLFLSKSEIVVVRDRDFFFYLFEICPIKLAQIEFR